MRKLSLRPARATGARRGAALVEFAFVAPIFFLMVLGLIEFGRAMMVQAQLTAAAKAGARAGSFDGSQSSDVTSAVNNYLSSAGISGATTTVSPSPPSSAYPGQNVTVTVTVPYTSVSWLPAPRFLKNTTLKSEALAQRETQ